MYLHALTYRELTRLDRILRKAQARINATRRTWNATSGVYADLAETRTDIWAEQFHRDPRYARRDPHGRHATPGRLRQ